jgi:dTMP kinase
MTCGLFVTIDGLGGVGKTTTARLVVDELHKRALPALYTREPSDSPTGRFVREQFGTMRGHALACLVAADRLDHVTTIIIPALQAGTTVICDRYIASSLVLQSLDGVPSAYIADLNSPARRPDLAVVLEAGAQTAWARINQRGSHGRFEEHREQSDVEHRAYKQVAADLKIQSWNIHTIDSETTTAPQVAGQIVELILAAIRSPSSD